MVNMAPAEPTVVRLGNMVAVKTLTAINTDISGQGGAGCAGAGAYGVAGNGYGAGGYGAGAWRRRLRFKWRME